MANPILFCKLIAVAFYILTSSLGNTQRGPSPPVSLPPGQIFALAIRLTPTAIVAIF